MRTICALLCLACSAAIVTAADPKPDFTLTVEEYAKAAKADGKAFSEKYKNKIVELSGVVWGPRVRSGDVVLTSPGAKKTDLDKNVSAAMPKYTLGAEQRGLAWGQKVTVRGKQANAEYPALTDCAFVAIGPSTAVPVTVSGLAEEFTKNRQSANGKYEDRLVVLRAKVVAVKSDKNKDEVWWTLGEPTGQGDARIEAISTSLFCDPFKVLEGVKEGDVIVLIGNVDSHRGTPCGLAFPLLLKEPPAGVKLPGDKK